MMEGMCASVLISQIELIEWQLKVVFEKQHLVVHDKPKKVHNNITKYNIFAVLLRDIQSKVTAFNRKSRYIYIRKQIERVYIYRQVERQYKDEK